MEQSRRLSIQGLDPMPPLILARIKLGEIRLERSPVLVQVRKSLGEIEPDVFFVSPLAQAWRQAVRLSILLLAILICCFGISILLSWASL